MSSGYEKWKQGKKIFKAPWIIEYWKSITDENQHRLANKCEIRFTSIMIVFSFLIGILFGFILWG